MAAGEACLLRIDSQTTWEPDRPESEEVPADDVARLTGYSSVSLSSYSSGPVSVDLGPTQSATLVKALDTLPLGPGPFCMEAPLLYTIVFLPPRGPGRQYNVRGMFCAAVVDVGVGGEQLHPLSDNSCSLFELVRRLLPPSATGTVSAGDPGCGRQFL